MQLKASNPNVIPLPDEHRPTVPEAGNVAYSLSPHVIPVSAVAQLMRCAVTTVEEKARNGEIPGLLWGDGGWVFPAEALLGRLNELALEHAAKRRTLLTPLAVHAGTAVPARKGRPLPTLPTVPS